MTREYAEEVALRLGARSLGVSEGASEGDVLAFDADGEVTAAAPSGGSSPSTLARAIYDSPSAATNVSTNARTALSFGTKLSGTDILDLTVPTKPVVLADGVYAVAATVNFVVAPTTVSYLQIDLEMDPDNEDADTLVLRPTSANTGVYEVVNSTYYLPAGAAITINIRHGYVAAQDFGVNVVMQRVA